jgi:hypothetical protein
LSDSVAGPPQPLKRVTPNQSITQSPIPQLIIDQPITNPQSIAPSAIANHQ